MARLLLLSGEQKREKRPWVREPWPPFLRTLSCWESQPVPRSPPSSLTAGLHVAWDSLSFPPQPPGGCKTGSTTTPGCLLYSISLGSWCLPPSDALVDSQQKGPGGRLSVEQEQGPQDTGPEPQPGDSAYWDQSGVTLAKNSILAQTPGPTQP